EIYGPEAEGRQRIAEEVLSIFESTAGIVDADWYVEADQPKLRFTVDRQKAALNGISDADIAESLALAAEGTHAGLLHDPLEKEDVPIEVRLTRAARSNPKRLEQLKIRTASGALAPLSEFVFAEQVVEDKSIYHKNLMPVTYVTADVAGQIESPVYAMLEVQPLVDEIATGGDYKIEQYTASLPFNDDRYALKWDGEWHIT